MAEFRVPLWEVKASMDLVSSRGTGEAFLAARPGRKYLLFFPAGGLFGVDLSDFDGRIARIG